MLDNLEAIAEGIRTTLDAKHTVREATLTLARVLTRHCANAIRAMHRQEWENAMDLLKTAQATLEQMAAGVRD
ncbi:MAG TPA: hypothetical protein VKQ72_18205, partial [Aggregatilineales bacterium]|nr:hypothetical protein [Aggregatilineales bacterium]